MLMWGEISLPKKSRRDILRTEVDILNYEKMSVSVKNYKVKLKIGCDKY